MSRTRKWALVEQEATRLAGLGVGPREICERLGVNRSTVTRWIQAGKLPKTSHLAARAAQVLPGTPGAEHQTPSEWAASIRASYQLDVTDEQLVKQAEEALVISLDAEVKPQVRLAASGRFQSIVRQLALVSRRAAEEAKRDAEAAEAAPVRQVPRRRTGTDPRALLMAVK